VLSGAGTRWKRRASSLAKGNDASTSFQELGAPVTPIRDRQWY
jgi:hypothetical protein